MSDYEIVPALYAAFAHFNRALFNGTLPNVVITLHRHRSALGYFRNDAYARRHHADQKAHEIALNPDTFDGRTDDEILSTLVHEMVHLQQQISGKPSRNGYHNKQWAKLMLEVGLEPFNVQNPDKQTGQRCSHHVQAGGRFAVACAALQAGGFEIALCGLPGEVKAHAVSKVAYECLDCDVKVWGKSGLNVVCGECGQRMAEADAA